jgi:ribosome assembly protein YihI (activator of Der GTPase)
MFEQALKATRQLSASDRDALIARLDRVRTISHNFGYGVGDEMDDLLVDYTGT